LHLVFTEKYLPSLVRGTTQLQGRWMPYHENTVVSWLDILTKFKSGCSAGNFRFFLISDLLEKKRTKESKQGGQTGYRSTL
jgi:hypothetical protein